MSDSDAGFFRNVNSRPGLVDGRLRACVIDGNCICTEGRDGDALAYGPSSPDEARRRLDGVLATVSRLDVRTRDGDYVHATVRSRWFGFVDDVEFRFDDHAEYVHVRSASRLGRADFGVNAARMADLRRRWDATSGPAA